MAGEPPGRSCSHPLHVRSRDRVPAAARERLATGRRTRLSEIGRLDPHAFALLLGLLGEALTAQASPEDAVEPQTGDGLLNIRLEPMAAYTHAEVVTDAGVFAGRDHYITITATPGS